jgi:hypothetical protein
MTARRPGGKRRCRSIVRLKRQANPRGRAPYHAAMTMTGKRGGPAKRKSDRKPAPDLALPSANTFIRVYHSEALHRRTLAVLGALEQADDPTTHREALANLIVELTSSALDYCFMQPLRLTNPGFIVERIASLGMTGVQQIIGPAVHQIIGHMDGKQLLSISHSIRKFMV